MKILEKNDNFKELINSDLTLVDFYAEWCGPCKMMMPILESIKDIKIIKVNVDEFEKIAMEYRIMSIPTLIFFKNGEIVKEVVGFHPKNEIEEIIKSLNA